MSECTKLTIPSIASSTLLLLIFDLYPNAFITHMFTSSNISGDLIAAFIRSAISLDLYLVILTRRQERYRLMLFPYSS